MCTCIIYILTSIFTCNQQIIHRNKTVMFIKSEIYECSQPDNNVRVIKFISLMNSKSPSVIKNISKFLIKAFDRRNTILA